MYRFVIFSTYIFVYICLAREVKLPQVTIPGQGTIVGVELSKLRIQKIVAYYGIPYAMPPVGVNRFAPPVTDTLPEARNNTDYLPACLQSEEDYEDADKPFLQLISDLKLGEFNEDCLYLNVFTPVGNAPPNGYATIIWFHPGSFAVGTPAIWNPHSLVYRQKVIVVTLSWRLNIFGFLTTMDGEAPGNYGLLDQQAAMQWVKRNIQLFGGNPDNICLMGYGAGATSVGLHMVSPKSRGLFNKAIAMSGDYLSPSVVKRPEEDKELIDFLVKEIGCSRRPTSLLIQCLRTPDAENLIQLIERKPVKVSWRPLLDAGLSNVSSAFLPDLPINYFQSGNYFQVPFLTGYTQMEKILRVNVTVDSEDKLKDILTSLVYSDVPQNNDTESSCVYSSDHIMDAVMFFYGPPRPTSDVEEYQRIVADFMAEKDYAAITALQASYMSEKQPTYVYRFDMKPSTLSAVTQIPEWVTVPHLFDLIYVWGVPYWDIKNVEWDIRDKRISDTIMSLWTNFAKSSDPTEFSVYPIKWDPFNKVDQGIMIIGGTFNMSDAKKLNYKAFEFWNEYYPKVKETVAKCCELSDSGTIIILHIYWLFFVVTILIMFNC